jgi:hypothetical protein
MSLIEFYRLLDGTEHNRMMKINAYDAFISKRVQIFYPKKTGFYKYLIDGEHGIIARSLHDGTYDSFTPHQVFNIEDIK